MRFLNRFKKKKDNVIIPSESTKELDINKILSTDIEFNNLIGWVRLDLNEIINSDEIKNVLIVLSNSENEWVQDIDYDWWLNIKEYSNHDLFKISLNINKNRYDNNVENIKRELTISCIIFNLMLPNNLVLLDNDTISKLCKYLILTQNVNVDVTKSLPGVIIEKINRFKTEIAIEELMNNSVFINLVNKIDRVSKLPNLLNLYNLVISYEKGICRFKKKDSELLLLNYTQFKKVLSCIFLSIGISIPRDYLYIDMDVIDYVLNGNLMPDY